MTPWITGRSFCKIALANRSPKPGKEYTTSKIDEETKMPAATLDTWPNQLVRITGTIYQIKTDFLFIQKLCAAEMNVEC